MGKLSHINSVEKANAVIESVERLWDEGKTIDDYISSSLKKGRIEGWQKGVDIGILKGRQEGVGIGILKGRQEGRQEGLQKPILNLYKKGYNAEQIADLLDFELDFVQEVIYKNNG